MRCHMRRRLRDRGVPDMANLAMLLVVVVSMPVGDRERAQRDHREDQRHGQQTYCYSLRHAEPDAPLTL